MERRALKRIVPLALGVTVCALAFLWYEGRDSRSPRDTPAPEVGVQPLRGARLCLRVRAEQGEPVPEAHVGVYLLGADYADTRQVHSWSVSDHLGRVALEDVPADEPCTLVVLPPGQFAPLLVRGWRPDNADIRLAPCSEIEGRLCDLGGARLARAGVLAFIWGDYDGGGSRYGRNHASTTTDSDGHFTIAGLPKGKVLLYTLPSDAPRTSATTHVVDAPGTVNLAIDTGVTWSFVIEDWKAGEAGSVQLVREESGPHPWSTGGSVEQARCSLSGVPADGTYTLWVPPNEEGKLFFARGLKPETRETVIHRSRGQPLTCEFRCPDDAATPSVYVFQHGIHFGFAEVHASGRHVFPFMPDGVWTVTAAGGRLDKSYKGTAEVAAGGTGVIRMKLEPPASER